MSLGAWCCYYANDNTTVGIANMIESIMTITTYQTNDEVLLLVFSVAS